MLTPQAFHEDWRYQQLPVFQASEPLQHASWLSGEFDQAKSAIEVPLSGAEVHYAKQHAQPLAGSSQSPPRPDLSRVPPMTTMYPVPASVSAAGMRGMDVDPFIGESTQRGGQESYYVNPQQAAKMGIDQATLASWFKPQGDQESQ